MLLVQCASIDPEFEKFSNIGIGKLTDYAIVEKNKKSYVVYNKRNAFGKVFK
jgi:hypothetical protein